MCLYKWDVLRNFTYPTDIVIDKKDRRHLHGHCPNSAQYVCQKLMDVCEICWVNIYIIYIYKNAFDFSNVVKSYLKELSILNMLDDTQIILRNLNGII